MSRDATSMNTRRDFLKVFSLGIASAVVGVRPRMRLFQTNVEAMADEIINAIISMSRRNGWELSQMETLPSQIEIGVMVRGLVTFRSGRARCFAFVYNPTILMMARMKPAKEIAEEIASDIENAIKDGVRLA